MEETILEVKNLTKKFGQFTAVNDISFEAREGEILGLLGPNGAGKTTTIQMLLGLTSATAGRVLMFGQEFESFKSQILKRVNFASAYTSLPWRLTVEENLRVFGRLYEVENLERRIDEVLGLFEVRDLRHLSFRQLSAGQRTRVMLSKALLNKPRILFLDEPTASLDPDLADKTRRYILDLQKKEGLTVLFTSHNMLEVEEVCQRVIFLDHGKIIAEDSPADLARRSRQACLKLFVDDKVEELVKFAQGLGLPASGSGHQVLVEIDEGEIANFLQSLAQRSLTYSEITIDKPRLEDFFLEVVRG